MTSTKVVLTAKDFNVLAEAAEQGNYQESCIDFDLINQAAEIVERVRSDMVDFNKGNK